MRSVSVAANKFLLIIALPSLEVLSIVVGGDGQQKTFYLVSGIHHGCRSQQSLSY